MACFSDPPPHVGGYERSANAFLNLALHHSNTWSFRHP
jgi:hypothetical protein